MIERCDREYLLWSDSGTRCHAFLSDSIHSKGQVKNKWRWSFRWSCQVNPRASSEAKMHLLSVPLLSLICLFVHRSSLEEEPLFKWQSNESKIVASGHHMMNSTWSSTVERTLLKPHLVPKKTDTTGILHHASDKEEPVSPVGVAEKKGHSAYEMMINSLEEQASTKDGKWNNDCCAAQGTGVDGTGTSMDQEHCWMKFVCGVDSGPAGSMPSSPPAVVSLQNMFNCFACDTNCLCATIWSRFPLTLLTRWKKNSY